MMIRFLFGLILSGLGAAQAAPGTGDYYIELLRWEGYRLKPYRDGAGHTVGVGHNLGTRTPKPAYTHKEVQEFFQLDLAEALAAAHRNVGGFMGLPDEVQQVVIGLIWTCGPAGFRKWERLRAALGRRDYPRAAAELLDSKWAGQVPPARLAAYYAALYKALPEEKTNSLCLQESNRGKTEVQALYFLGSSSARLL